MELTRWSCIYHEIFVCLIHRWLMSCPWFIEINSCLIFTPAPLWWNGTAVVSGNCLSVCLLALGTDPTNLQATIFYVHVSYLLWPLALPVRTCTLLIMAKLWVFSPFLFWIEYCAIFLLQTSQGLSLSLTGLIAFITPNDKKAVTLITFLKTLFLCDLQ